jgi:hypothetical protein
MSSPRRGALLLEATIALFLISGVAVATAQLLALVARQRQASLCESAAQCEAANVLERIAALEYEQLTDEAASAMALSKEARAALPGGKLKVDLVAAEDQPRHKRIVVEVRWSGARGQPRALQLVGWKYAFEGAAP